MDLFSTPHIIVLLIIVLLLFGPAKLPKLAQSIGQSVRELKRGFHGMGEDLKEPPRPAQTQASAGSVPGTQPQTPQFGQPALTSAEPVDSNKSA